MKDFSYPIEDIRSQFPALQRKENDEPVVYFDGPSGTQVCQAAIDGITKYLKQGSANLGGMYPTSRETEDVVTEARKAMADMLGCGAHEIAFGMNMTSLTFDISRALSRDWKAGDEVVVTELDHRANVDPWIEAANDKGIEVKWIKLNNKTLTLDLSDLDEIITENTVVVAIGHASNGIGTINEVRKIANEAKKVGAVVVMDAVHSAPHMLIDQEDLGVDIILCSSYKFFGPHLGIAAIREELFSDLKVYRLTTAPKYLPGKLETGTQSFEALSGLVGTVNFIASLGTGTTRRNKIQSAFSEISRYEEKLAEYIRQKLSSYDEVRQYQASSGVNKTPTIAFRVKSLSPAQVCEYLAEHGIYAGNGHFYARTIGDLLGLNDTGGWIRIGMAPYNTMSEVERFLLVMDRLISSNRGSQ